MPRMRKLRLKILFSLAATILSVSSACFPVPVGAIEGSFTVTENLVAETRAVVEIDSDNLAVITVYIDRIKDNATGDTRLIPGGIGSYSATISADNGITVFGVRSVPPFDNAFYESSTGVFSVSSVTFPVQPDNTPVAKLVASVTGDCLTQCIAQITFEEIRSATEPSLNVPQEMPVTLSFLRGDAKVDGIVNIVDAMFIAQYTVRIRIADELNALNGASVRQDAIPGDILNIVDAMFIAQYTVRIRDDNFEMP